MKIIEINEDKAQSINYMLEEMLTIGGRLMSCFNEMLNKNRGYDFGYRNDRGGGRGYDDRGGRDDYRYDDRGGRYNRPY